MRQYVPCLGHGAFTRIHEKEHGIDGREDALHFSGEVCVARCVDDIDPAALPLHGTVLGADGDALFPLQLVVVHDPLFNAGILPEYLGSPEDRVYECGLAVVDMGDNGYIAYVFRSFH